MIDINRNLILVKGKDKTKDILSWEYSSGYYLITYELGHKTYRYNSANVCFYKNPKELSPLDYRIVKNGQALSNVVRIQLFENHVRLFYKNRYHGVFEREEISIIPSCLRETKINDKFTYFKELAHIDTLLGNDGLSILGKRYDKIDFIREDSILSDYLRGEIAENNQIHHQKIYYPFGFNISQKQAIDNALNNRLSVIEGPPGTGKTQTILNIVANIVMSGQSVAVVSSNNSATENVEEKLKKYDVDFISAFLGNSANKESFLLTQKEIPDFSNWSLSEEQVRDIEKTISGLSETLNEKLQLKNDLSELNLALDSMQVEHQHFSLYYTETNSSDIDFKSIVKLKSSNLLKLMVQAEIQHECAKPTSFWKKLLNFFRFGIYNADFYNNPLERIVALCQRRFYEVRIDELKTQIESIEAKLLAFDFNSKMKQYSDLSMKLFHHFLSKKYENQDRKIYSGEELWKNSRDFIDDYPVILSTTHSLRSSLSNEFIYDYIIVDEASQVNVTTGALAFSCAKRGIVVGDLKQLPNVVDSQMKSCTDAVFKSYELPEAYRYSNHSLLLSITELFSELPHTMLREHYRCHPKIINFCNQKYYNNQLIIMTEDTTDKMPLLVYKTVPGNHARDHVNQRQIDVIMQEVIPQQGVDTKNSSVGIVTPYRNQANALQKAFAGTSFKADTVDKFQGQERDIIIISTVDNDISDFADDDQRLNVAVSRAAKQLIILVSGNQPTRETGIGDLVHYIQYNNMDVINSEIYSVFDLLYGQYSEVRRSMLSKQKIVSRFDSENLMYGIITDVLKESNFQKYGVLTHVPLRMILRDLSKLETDRETQFVMNENTHVDFLFYDRLSHQPVLILEVDGSSYHKEGTVQEQRDRLKDQICARYRIPLERFRTDESSEKQRIMKVLTEITT